MSNLAVNAITDASGGTTASINGYTPSASNMAGRNRIINGAMMIDQRNAGAGVTYDGSSGYSLDRYFSSEIGNGAFTVQQVTDAPAGFTKSLKVTVTTAQTGTLNAATLQAIEGFNTADFAWGTASASSVTLSFWVKSSVTGTLGGVIQNAASNRSYPFTYTVNSASTWEQKTITIPGDTTGTWATDNTAGLWLRFTHGTSTTGTASAWAGADYRGPTGATWVIQTLNATWQVTGVQLEAGSVATPFEHRLYGQELALCQRYLPYIGGISGNQSFGQCYANSTTTLRAVINFPVQARVYPTGLVTSTASGFVGQMQGSSNFTVSALAITSISGLTSTLIELTVSGATAGQPGSIYNASAGFMYFTGCEL